MRVQSHGFILAPRRRSIPWGHAADLAGPRMKITGLGHASVLIETAHGSILTDPWVNPAYFGSWFPFPDNSQLDWDRFGQADYLFVSHLHRDHFDPEHLRKYMSKKATVLLPEFPTTELEDALRELGFTSFVAPASGEVVDLDGLQVMIQALTSPTDGPIGDSSLWVSDGEQTRAQPERRAPVGAGAVQGARSRRRVPGAVLRRDLVPDGLRAAGTREAGAGHDQARAAVRPHAALHRRTRRALRVPHRRAAVLPRRGAVGVQRHLRRRVEHLPRPDRLPGLAGRAGPRRGPAAAAGHGRRARRAGLPGRASL